MTLLILASIVFALPTVAQAHARVVHADPADNATLKTSPPQVHFEFTEPVSSQFSSFRVLDVNGQPVVTGDVILDATHKQVTMSLPKLGDGIYSVVWKAVSDRDGHITRGHIVFAVGDVALAAATSAGEENNPTWIEIALRWINLIAIASFAGGYIISRMCLQSQSARSWGLGWAAVWSRLALLACLGLLAQQIAVLAEASATAWVPLTGNGLTQTGWGHAWLLRAASIIVFIVCLRLLVQSPGLARRSVPSVLALLSIVGVCVAQALGSHASQSLLTVALQTVHSLAACVWLGGLAVMVLTSALELRRANGDAIQSLKSTWLAFSRLALVSMVALVVTGLLNMSEQVSTPDALLMTSYGRALLVKILIIGGVVLIAGANWSALRNRTTDLMRLMLRGRVEVVLGVLILAVTALLTASSPANGPEFEAPVPAQDTVSTIVDDLLVTLSAKPNRPGPNVFTVVAASSRRPARAEVLRVQLKFINANADLGEATAIAEQVDTNTYRVGGNYLSMPGPWQVEMLVRRKGLEDVVTQFEWTVPNPAAAAQPVVVSNQPIRLPLMWAGLAAALLLPSLAMGASRLAKRQTA